LRGVRYKLLNIDGVRFDGLVKIIDKILVDCGWEKTAAQPHLGQDSGTSNFAIPIWLGTDNCAVHRQEI